MLFLNSFVGNLALFAELTARLLAFLATSIGFLILFAAFTTVLPLILVKRVFTGLADVLGDYK